MSKEIIFEIPVRTPMLNEYVRWHWRKQRGHTVELAWMVREAVGPRSTEPVKRCVLIIERHSWGQRRRDWDGLFGGMKGLIDALTATHQSGVGLIEDDSTECIITMPTVMDVRCEKGKEKTVVRIIPMEDE